MNKNRKIKLVALALLSSIGTSVTAEQTDLLSVYQQALTNDTQYKISEANLRSTEQNVRISRSNLLPQISASATFNKRDTDFEPAGLDGSPSTPFNQDRQTTTYRLDLRQVIFDWSQWVALDQAEMRLRVSELNHAASLQNLMIRTSQAYFNVLSAEENLDITKAEKQALEQQLSFTREQYESGLANSTDFLDAQANYDQSLANVVSLENSLQIAKESLREITGQYYMELEGIGDDVTMSQPSPNNIDDWMRVAREANLGLKAQQMNVRVARKDIKRNQSGHYPTVNFNADYTDNETDTTRTASGSSIDSLDLSDGYSASITFSVPLFSGFRTTAQTEQAKQNYLSNTHQLEQQDRLVQRNARNAFNALQASILSFEANKRAVDSSSGSLEATREGYQAGTRNIVDVLRATRSLYAAKRNLTRAKYDYLINSLRLKEAAGTLTEEDVTSVNQWLKQY